MINTTITIKGELYTLIQKESDRYGQLRFTLSKEGQEKPYNLSISSTLYKDSEISGYGCSCKGWVIKKGEKRSCKHIRALAELIAASIAA